MRDEVFLVPGSTAHVFWTVHSCRDVCLQAQEMSDTSLRKGEKQHDTRKLRPATVEQGER
jgi:hypothetical protein